MTERKRFDYGATLYTVTLQFSDDYPRQDDADAPEGCPANWDWAGLINQPDAEVISYAEISNPEWVQPPTPADVLRSQLAVSHAQADRMMAERDRLAGMLASITGEDYTPVEGTVWLFDDEAVQA